MTILSSALVPFSRQPVSFLQFGDTPRLRASIDYVIQYAMERGQWTGCGALIDDHKSTEGKAFRAQQGRYTVRYTGHNPDVDEPDRKIISVLENFSDPRQNYAEFLHLAENTRLKYIFSDTGEQGIQYLAKDFSLVHCPKTYPGMLLGFLRHRYESFGADYDAGIVIIPLEENEDNGTMLKRFLLRLARDHGYDNNFQIWLSHACRFFDTRLSVQARTADEEEKKKLQERTGYWDDLYTLSDYSWKLIIAGPDEQVNSLPLLKYPNVVGKRYLEDE